MSHQSTKARFMARLAAVVSTFLLLCGTVSATDVVTYYHSDGLGTPVMESNASGQVTYTREHRPYGDQALGTSKNGPGFTGHVGDVDTGLIYMQARYYDPAAGRFLSNDPVAASPATGANFNRYWYANNNPYKFIDPDGRRAKTSGLCDWAGGCEMGSFGGDSGGSRDSGSIADRMKAAIPFPLPMLVPLPVKNATPSEDGETMGEQLVDAWRARQEQKTHVTYILTKPGFPTSSTYVGRASGFGTPMQVMMQRFSGHGMRLFGYGSPVLDKSGFGESGRIAVRGREQQLIDAAGGVGAVGVGNRIRAVSPVNPFGRDYHDASNAMFGPLAPYTGGW